MSPLIKRPIPLLLALAISTWCLASRYLHAEEPPQEIRIAGLFDLTGGGAIWGKSERNAFLLACKDFQKAHTGLKVTPIVEDTMFSSRQTVTALQKISSVDKVGYVIGATWETTVAMMPLCEAKKIICLSPSYHGKEYYARPWRYNFTAWFDDREYAGALVNHINERGYKRIAIFAALTPYYDSLVEHFTPRFKGQITNTQRMVLDERDFRSMIAKVPLDVDGVVMLLDNAGQIQAFLKQWSELRRDRPDIYSDDLIAYLEPPEDIARYGFRYFYSYPIFEQGALHEFNQRYRSEFHELPQGSSAVVAYDEATLLLSCMASSQKVDAVRECLVTTREYHGLSGTFSFNGKQTASGRQIGIKPLERYPAPS